VFEEREKKALAQNIKKTWIQRLFVPPSEVWPFPDPAELISIQTLAINC
jgi:hypothetical protein